MICRTAFSLIVSEARDFACDLLDADGYGLAHSRRAVKHCNTEAAWCPGIPSTPAAPRRPAQAANARTRTMGWAGRLRIKKWRHVCDETATRCPASGDTRRGTEVRASGYERIARDWYVEPPWIVSALLDVEPLGGRRCWDPCCGAGNIPMVLQSRGIECRGSDIADRGYGEVADFFRAKHRTDVVISNPPYSLIESFILHALDLARDRVIVLARLAFLEGIRRKAMFMTTPLARILVSSRRVNMPPGGSNIEAKGGAIPYAWFVWEHRHAGPAVVGWLP